jgi:hypothetical protein
MYINKIDDLIDKVIDDFNSTVILSDNRIPKILKELNFVKYQSDMNEMFKKYINSINLNEIKTMVSNNDILNKIIGVLKKYITIYMFLFIGFYFNGTDTIYANNIIEFSKNQPEFGFKIEEFFNSESNAVVVELYSKVKKIISFLGAESKQRREALKTRPDYKHVVSFLDGLGEQFVEAAFNIEDKNYIRAHNLIKTIIIIDIYKNTEKKDLFRILDLLENTETEFTFIDVVIPIKEIIDISTIESLLSKKDVSSGMAKVIWEYIYESEVSDTKLTLNHDEKVNEIINSKLFTPIVDDILLYHNQNETYEKSNEDGKSKKREDTKIRYIIDKIDMATNLNIPQNHSDAKKLFYQPMYNRKAVLINNFEDTKIINKFINVGKLSAENSEYLKDLEHIVIYPYLNLRDSPNGLMVQITKTIDALRYVNFENTTEYKQRQTAFIENRVGTKDNFLNMVGFLIKPQKNSLYCIKNKDLKSITNNKEKNGFKICMEIIEETISKKEKNNMNLYWLFDPDEDKIEQETYEQQNKLTRSDQIKHIISALYDSLEKLTYDTILNISKKLKNPYLNSVERVMDYYCDKILKIQKQEYLLEMENAIYNKIIKRGVIKYDELDDLVNGLSKDSIELPNMKNEKNKNINKVVIDLSKLSEVGTYEEKESVDGVCQHNITWDRLGLLKRENPKLFLDELYIFVQQYVVENVDHDYVCKSCGFFLNIKKYVADGSFDDDHHFITYSMPLDTPLEDIPEYEKYKSTIRNIDKYIEKIALITNIPYFTGSNPTVKSRRKLVVRDAIDIIVSNNQKLKKTLKERNELANKIYGINRDFSNLFVFELENSIFIFSSKDKDFYKPIKQNNILGYIIFLILLELNESQISYFNNDKKGFCNFPIFDKVYHTLFEGLKFRKNNKGDTINVKEFEIFCYMLYMISCYCVKYNLWYYDYKDKTNDKSYRQKLLPTVQKIIIHTVIDIINSCLENAEEDKKNKIFEILKTKFYKKLNLTFSNKDLYLRLKQDNSPSTIGDKKSFIMTKAEAYILNGKYLTEFETPKFWRKVKPATFRLEIKSRDIEIFEDINNITNCETGDFHEWLHDNKMFKCKKCNVTTRDIKFNKAETDKIKNKFHLVELRSLSKKYCLIDGLLHEFITNKDGKKICSKCKNEDIKVYSDTDLEKLDKQLIENKKKTITKNLNFNTELSEENKKYDEYITKLKEKITNEYKQNTSEQYKYIDDLIELIENNISDDLVKSNISIKHNLYIFDHDYLGIKLDKEIIINEKDNKIQSKSAHPFFNTDVIYYTSYKNGKIDVFYDAVTKILLGYKEENKNFTLNIKSDKKIKINHSIKNKLKMLGHKYQIYNINNEETIKDDILTIIRDRHDLLRNTIYRFQRLIYRIINNYFMKKKVNEYDKINEEEDYFSNKYESLVDKYSKKLSKINLVSQNGSHLILKHWKNIADNLTNDVDIDIDKIMSISSDKINKLDNNGNLLLFYFINEINKLYKYNDDKSIRINITSLLVDFININFSIYNEEQLQNDKDFKRFWYVINSQLYINEIKDKVGETEGIYEEATDPDKKEMSQEEQDAKDDAREEDEALDVEGNEIDYEAGYERNMERSFDDGFIENYSYSYLDYVSNK